MRRKRAGKDVAGNVDVVPPVHHIAVGFLVTANLATFAASFFCLRQLGQAETASFREPTVDLSGLYDENAANLVSSAGNSLDLSGLYKEEETALPAPTPVPMPTPAPTPQAPSGVVKDLFPGIPQVTIAAMPVQVPQISVAAMSAQEPFSATPAGGSDTLKSLIADIGRRAGIPVNTQKLEVPTMLSEADRAKARTAVKACKPCSSQVRGPLPTTLSGLWAGPTVKGPIASACKWITHPRSFLSDIAGDVEVKFDLEVAQEFCIELASSCHGVTCENEKKLCTVRAGNEPHGSPNPGETSYLKSCGPTFYSTAGRLSDLGSECKGEQAGMVNSPVGELQAPALVILAHKRGDALKACLDALLIQPEIKLFKIFVSVDLRESVQLMKDIVLKAQEFYGAEPDITVWETDRFFGDPAKHNKDQIAWFQFNAGKIAHHYYAVFERTFVTNSFHHAVFMEEDLIAAPDFLALFRSGAGLMEVDPSIWCIGAWNDIGMSVAFSDQCRLLRTSYFPGLGFLLTKVAWDRLRTMWPTAPTMGWDYWMRVAFRKEGKECIIPEVPRIHHMIGSGGSSITNNKQFKLFKSMGLAQIESTCTTVEPCQHFGDISYLLEKAYDESLKEVVSTLPTTSVEVIRSNGGDLDRHQTYVVPYIFEEYPSFVELVGLRPRGTKTAIPQDIRSEHYGLFDARHLQSRARLIFVDRRSSRHFLPEQLQVRMTVGSVMVAGQKGESCTAICRARTMTCSAPDMHFLNNCNALEKHFGCEGGCAHQVGKELPVYVPDETQPTYRQCLVTFISPLQCHSAHPSTARLCACSAER